MRQALRFKYSLNVLTYINHYHINESKNKSKYFTAKSYMSIVKYNFKNVEQ